MITSYAVYMVMQQNFGDGWAELSIDQLMARDPQQRALQEVLNAMRPAPKIVNGLVQLSFERQPHVWSDLSTELLTARTSRWQQQADPMYIPIREPLNPALIARSVWAWLIQNRYVGTPAAVYKPWTVYDETYSTERWSDTSEGVDAPSEGRVDTERCELPDPGSYIFWRAKPCEFSSLLGDAGIQFVDSRLTELGALLLR